MSTQPKRQRVSIAASASERGAERARRRQWAPAAGKAGGPSAVAGPRGAEPAAEAFTRLRRNPVRSPARGIIVVFCWWRCFAPLLAPHNAEDSFEALRASAGLIRFLARCPIPLGSDQNGRTSCPG